MGDVGLEMFIFYQIMFIYRTSSKRWPKCFTVKEENIVSNKRKTVREYKIKATQINKKNNTAQVIKQMGTIIIYFL